MYGHWFTFIDFNPDSYYGFVYLIINNFNGRKYIGQKTFGTSYNPWPTYTGSQSDLNDDIKLYGNSQFSFIILELIKGEQADLDEYERELQIKNKVLDAVLPCGTREFYNLHIHRMGFVSSIKGKIKYYHSNSGKSIFLSPNDKIPKNYIKGTSPSLIKRQTEPNKNRKAYHDPLTEKVIHVKDKCEAPAGYVRGLSPSRKLDNSRTKGKRPYHNPVTQHEILLGINDIIPFGYIYGQSASHKAAAYRDQSGEKNHNSDLTEYTFKHKTGISFNGTQTSFFEQYGKMQISHMKQGIEKSVRGWKIISINGKSVKLVLNENPDHIYKNKFRYIEI